MGSGNERTLEFSVSRHFWRLATQAIHLHSNGVFRFVSLAELLSDLTNAAAGSHCDTTILRNHFATIPTSGPISLVVTIDQAVLSDLEHLSQLLAAQLNGVPSVADAISFVCFNCIGDYRAGQILRSADEENDD